MQATLPMDELKGQMRHLSDVIRFVVAGNSTFTIRSPRTGTRFTYKVRRASDDRGQPKDFWFVSLLTGQDNESDFQYFGHFGARRGAYHYDLGRKAKIKADAPSHIAWLYFFQVLMLPPSKGQRVLDTIEFWHEGRCGRCNRKLTVPSSISTGFGPECANYV